MNRKVLQGIAVTMLIMFLGVNVYAAKLMIMVEREITPKPDQALIVFMRPSPSQGRAFLTGDFGQSVSIYDVSGKETKLLGLMKGRTKICHDIDPGEYIFMVVGEAADFMKATVLAGKTYYATIEPRLGAWQARYSLYPLRQSDLADDKFAKWDSETKLVEKTPAAEKWARSHAPYTEEKRTRYWAKWLDLSPEDKDSMTLKAEDGR